MRIGTGYDLHRLEEGRPLILGGVHVPFDKGPVAHSDGDALAHAITDALLGAAALGNIGLLFPDSDPKYKDADSIALLAEATRKLNDAGYRVANVDATVIVQAPRLGPHLDAMRARLAEAMDVNTERVSVKAKSNEGVGPEGRGEAISVQATALIEEV